MLRMRTERFMKKTILGAVLALVALPAFSQAYKITGKAPKGATKVYFSNVENRRQVDSVAVVNEKFTFSGDAQGKMFGWVFTKSDNPLPVFLDGQVEVSLEQFTAKGTKENEAMNVWAKRMKTYDERSMAIYEVAKSYGNALPDSVRARLIKQLTAVEEERTKELRTLFATHNKEQFPAYFLALYERNLESAELIALLEAAPSYAQQSVLASLKSQIEGRKRQAIGASFTDLTVPDTAGTPRKISEFVGNGKYVLLDFWASWCGPCIREMPNVKRAYERFHAKGFDIVGISFDRDRKSWLGAIKRLELPWHHLSDLKAWQAEAASVYGITGIPFMLLLDPNGKIIANDFSNESLQQKLEKLLGE